MFLSRFCNSLFFPFTAPWSAHFCWSSQNEQAFLNMECLSKLSARMDAIARVHSFFLALHCLLVCLFVCLFVFSFVFPTIVADSFLLAVEWVLATIFANPGGGREVCTSFFLLWCGCYKLAVFCCCSQLSCVRVYVETSHFSCRNRCAFFISPLPLARLVGSGWLWCGCFVHVVSANFLGYFKKSMFLAKHFLQMECLQLYPARSACDLCVCKRSVCIFETKLSGV